MIRLDDPANFINREWSWLEFNSRVLHEAREDRNPILERLKFTAIVSSNLEEFFMVRVAALKKQAALHLQGDSCDQLSPEEQLLGIRKRVEKMVKDQYENFNQQLLPALRAKNIDIIFEPKDLEKHRPFLHTLFQQQMKKILTPISVGPTHPFPNLVSGKNYMAVELEPHSGNPSILEKSHLSFVQIPTGILGRFIRLPDTACFIPLGNVIKMFISEIYNGYEVISAGLLKITRDADFSVDPDAVSDLLKEIESNIKQMHKRSVVRLEYEKSLSPRVLKTLTKELEIKPEDMYPINGILRLQDLFEICSQNEGPGLKDEVQMPVYPQEFKDADIFRVIREKSPVLYHPYHSYDPVVELLMNAAQDKNVLAIKMTLYRTSSQSRIIEALVKAAENGKYVSIVDELQARFDEKRNIDAAHRLEDAGAHVIYGISGLKTHAKCLLIVRREGNEIRRYVHMATGNYNEQTARLYTDFSYFTSDPFIGEDASTLFNLLTGFSIPEKWNRLTTAPLGLRQRFLALIRRELQNARNGLEARIVAKVNSLLDQEIVMALYEASQAGVRIALIVRGICALRPGIKGLSDNITVQSIVGRYLEHPRIYYFYNGGDEEYYLASADWMTRNLDRRVELLFPIEGRVQKKFIQDILDYQFKDNSNTWILNSDGSYSMAAEQGKKDSFVSIYQMIRNLEEKQKKEQKQIFTPIRSIKE